MNNTDSESAQNDSIRKHQDYLFPAVAMYYQNPIALDHGAGMYVWDESGNRYLDCFGGVLTTSVGHVHPHVTAAVVDQLQKLAHTSTLYANRPQSELARKLAEITPGPLEKSFFSNSGTEADETATMAAKLYTGRQEIITLRHSYSGRSAAAISAAGQAPWRILPAQVPGYVNAPAPYCYRCPFKLKYPECDLACAKDLKEVIETSTSGKIAAFMAEPILGAGGFVTPPKEYFQEAVAIIRQYGGVFICDEVQTAWGRTGDRMFGIEHWGVDPDLMTFAKGMANGAPIGATIARPEIAKAVPGITFSTFGGNPVSMRAALATIEVIERENLAHNARVVGDYLRERLMGLQERFEIIGDVRGMGLMQALELVKDRRTKEPHPQAVLKVFEETKKRGVLIGKGGLYGNVIRLGPPLIATRDQIDELANALDEALATC
ncbi:MAG TPA: aspartate aminotransferase family protein [Blastocatellia bacterium]|nr:aspartate aminotransferase family protein [Blastocatellia bacterium]